MSAPCSASLCGVRPGFSLGLPAVGREGGAAEPLMRSQNALTCCAPALTLLEPSVQRRDFCTCVVYLQKINTLADCRGGAPEPEREENVEDVDPQV
jgi:hypothetical protein